ncbi:hypothetical protein IU450_28255 [Nocardia abscessus]|uniref:hypothetical protein n=1 Tax=Nocardia abscessus TaxID=120957 RepID=UPI00189464F6|nr:hypothetical protein [Nocardia abscessus]MBF6339752.1 hypothetical protein [Nocardia abscessus]
MTRTTFRAVVIAVAAVAAGCAANTATPNGELPCRAARFAPPFGAVDPCSAEAVLTAAVTAVFGYRPSEHLDQRGAFRVARPLMDSGFAQRAQPAALVWAPVSAMQWHQWRTDATTLAASARVTSDDHPADTATAVSRVLAVELEPSNQPPVRWAVYAHATRTTAGSAWLLSGLEVQA